MFRKAICNKIRSTGRAGIKRLNLPQPDFVLATINFKLIEMEGMSNVQHNFNSK